MKKILLLILLTCGIFWIFWASASHAVVAIPGVDDIRDVSLQFHGGSDTVSEINRLGFRILVMVKRILMGLLVIFMVYTGAMMIMSMGSDEEQLSSAKRQIWYALVALLFLNIPGSLYNVFRKDLGHTTAWNSIGNTFNDEATQSSGNLFFNVTELGYALNDSIVYFLEIMIFLAAVFMLTLAGISVMTSRWREEKMKEAKNKILYTILALIFVGMIEAWKALAFGGSISDGVNIFASLANLALFFAAPVAIFFLTLAGYYYITSNGDEERTKKAKSIIINTILATLILLAAYTFLLDLVTL